MNKFANANVKSAVSLFATLITMASFVASTDAKRPPRKKHGYSFVECCTLKLKQGPVLLREKPGGGFLC
jgi:hypothetical protein